MRGLGDEFVAGTFHAGAEANRNLTRTETKAEMIRRFASPIVERRFSNFDKHFGGRHREPLSCTNQKWHAGPAPRLNFQAQSRKRFHRGIRGNSFLGLVALELSSNQVLGVQRQNRAEYLNLLIPNSIAV